MSHSLAPPVSSAHCNRLPFGKLLSRNFLPSDSVPSKRSCRNEHLLAGPCYLRPVTLAGLQNTCVVDYEQMQVICPFPNMRSYSCTRALSVSTYLPTYLPTYQVLPTYLPPSPSLPLPLPFPLPLPLSSLFLSLSLFLFLSLSLSLSVSVLVPPPLPPPPSPPSLSPYCRHCPCCSDFALAAVRTKRF